MDGQIRVGPWLVEPRLNIVSRKGTAVRVEPKVMEVLVCLAAHPGEVLSKEELLKAVWPDTFVTDDALTHCISDLRRVLEDDAREPRVIQTIPKRGYRLVASVVPANGTQPSTQTVPTTVTGAVTRGARRLWTWAAVGGVVSIVILSVSSQEPTGGRGRCSSPFIPLRSCLYRIFPLIQRRNTSPME